MIPLGGYPDCLCWGKSSIPLHAKNHLSNAKIKSVPPVGCYPSNSFNSTGFCCCLLPLFHHSVTYKKLFRFIALPVHPRSWLYPASTQVPGILGVATRFVSFISLLLLFPCLFNRRDWSVWFAAASASFLLSRAHDGLPLNGILIVMMS
jgi:hypothetical protein